MNVAGKATKIRILSVATPHMRAFHLSWFAFFLCFFGWFGIAPLMVVVRDELQLTAVQIGNTVIASVAATVFARLAVGWLCDRIGPRRTYAGLLVLGALPVMGIGLANSYESFLLFRLAIGAIGASFVITQYHTSIMFAPNCVGTANATSAGWGNAGGGATQLVMPLLLSLLLGLGVGEYWGWRLAMGVPGVAMVLTGIAYLVLTQDTPEGNFGELRRAGALPERTPTGSFCEVARDVRVWALCVIYAACFGVELTLNNVAAMYFHDRFELSIGMAGAVAALFGVMNLFARTLGGWFADRAGARFGLRGRVALLGCVLFTAGAALMAFSQMGSLGAAIVALLMFSLFVQMSSGATFAVVPFINPRAMGCVAGIVGAGGNAGAVAAGFLFRVEGMQTSTALLCLGVAVTLASCMALAVRFTPADEGAHDRGFHTADPLRAVYHPRP